MKFSSLKSFVMSLALVAPGSCKKQNQSDSGIKGTSVGIQTVSPYSWSSSSVPLSPAFRADFTALNPDYETDLLLWCKRGSCGERELRLVIWKKGVHRGDDMAREPVTAVRVGMKPIVPVKKNQTGSYELEVARQRGYYYGLILDGKLISVGGSDDFDDLCRNSVHAGRIFAAAVDVESGTFNANEIYRKANCDFPELINGQPGPNGVVFK